MASTKTKREWWLEYRCTQGIKTIHGFFGRHPVYAANLAVAEAWKALEQAHLGSGYRPTGGGFIGSKRRCPAGIGGRECREDGGNCSLHNYCIALDIEYNYNKLGPEYPRPHTLDDIFVRDANLHKYTKQQIEIIENVRNLQGKALFRWLGWIGDYMHWEIDVAPEDVSVDWTTVPEAPLEDDIMYRGDRGADVAKLQNYLNRWIDAWEIDTEKTEEDGVYGADTERLVAEFQFWAHLTIDGSRANGITVASLTLVLDPQTELGTAEP